MLSRAMTWPSVRRWFKFILAFTLQLKLKKQLSAGIIRRLLAESSFVADANP